MPNRSKKPAGRTGRPRNLGPASLPVSPPQETSSSLPPTTPESAQEPPSKPELTRDQIEMLRDSDRPSWYAPDDSKIRVYAMQMIAMRISGMEDDEIAKTLGLSRGCISPYIYRAGKNGWLDLDRAKDRLEYQLLHKVVRNLDQALDSNAVLQTGMKESTAVALKVAEGTVFKQFGEQQTQTPQQTVVAVRIEMPAGERQQMREDTTGGLPAYCIEAEKA